MSQFRILDWNYCFESAVNFLPTSEDPAFPAENLSKYFRSKAWRSYGFFRIQSTNKYLNFKDTSGGGEITVTLTEQDYTAAELEAAIEDGMNASAGVGTYTVTFSHATGKWTIASDQADLRLLTQSGTNAANAVYSTIGFEVVTDYTGASTHTGPVIAIHTEERLVIDLGNPELIDSFAILFDPDLGHKFSNAATIKLQASSTNYWYGSPAVDVTLSFDDTYQCITHFFSTSQSYRYWCIRIVDPQNPYLYVELPKVLLSLATQLTQLPQIGFTDRYSDQSKQTENDYGHQYADIYPTRRSMRFNYQVLSESDLSTLVELEKRLGGVTPIGVGLDTEGGVFDKDRFFIYGRLSKNAEIANLAYTYFNTDITLEEAF